MKKFKHKITGNIATETNSGKNFKVTEPKSFTLPKWIIENSKEWEEVVEREYEILSFLTSSEEIVTLRSNGRYVLSTLCPSDCINGKGACLEEELEYLKDGHYNIHSIKRLSDGEVFTLKDKVKDPTGSTFTITRFYLDCNGEHLLANDESGRGHISITKIEKVKDPLFTTEDGYDRYEGQEYLFVRTDNWYLGSDFVSKEHISHGKKFFVLRQNAEKYIEENKPQYSKKDMVDFAGYAKYYCAKQTVGTSFNEWKALK